MMNLWNYEFEDGVQITKYDGEVIKGNAGEVDIEDQTDSVAIELITNRRLVTICESDIQKIELI